MASWSLGLVNLLKDTSSWIVSSKEVVVIADKFPKAKFHFLVLPRESIPTIFLLTRTHLKLLNEMYAMALKVIELKEQRLDDFKIGYHAEPSMQQLHLHVISTDFNSPALKTKKHWNSFNTEFFVTHHDMVKRIEADGKVAKLDPSTAKSLLGAPLKCHRCDEILKTIPALKSHLLKHI